LFDRPKLTVGCSASGRRRRIIRIRRSRRRRRTTTTTTTTRKVINLKTAHNWSRNMSLNETM
jgi:hypothetical protein